MFNLKIKKGVIGLIVMIYLPLLLFSQSDNFGELQNNRTSRGVQTIKKSGLSVEACRRIAYDYLKSEDNRTKAIPYFEFVLDADMSAPAADIRALARAYYYNNEFGIAIDLLNEYLGKVKGSKLKRNAKADITVYKHAQTIASDAKNVQLINLGSAINSRYSEINPFVSFKENLLVYSSNRRKSYNVYVCKKKNNQTLWNKPKLAGNLVNTIDDEFVAGLSPDGQCLFVHYNQFSGFEDINKSKRVSGLYRELDNMGAEINSTYKEEGACYSKSGDTLFFASNRLGGYGGFDLYYSLKLPGGEWGTPINLGPKINTSADENYPNLDPNSSLMYFASKGHGSIGGFDLFYTSLNKEKNEWANPENVGFPINNTYDNKTISFTESPRYAYISSILKQGKGSYDIYKVVFLENEADYLIVSGNVFVKESNKNIPFNKYNRQIAITVYKNNDLFGIYAFNKRRNNFILALGPGTYYLEIEADSFKPVKKKFTIKENHYRNKKRKVNIYLESE